MVHVCSQLLQLYVLLFMFHHKLERLLLFRWSCLWMTALLISTCLILGCKSHLRSLFYLFFLCFRWWPSWPPTTVNRVHATWKTWQALAENVGLDVAEDQECVNKWRGVSIASSSGDAVAARNGLWVTLRYKPCCAAAVQPESAACLPACQLSHSFTGFIVVVFVVVVFILTRYMKRPLYCSST